MRTIKKIQLIIATCCILAALVFNTKAYARKHYPKCTGLKSGLSYSFSERTYLKIIIYGLYLKERFSSKKGIPAKNFNATFEHMLDTCSGVLYWAKRLRPAVANLPNNKGRLKHCTISCRIALRCPRQAVLTLGFVKELMDMFKLDGEFGWDDIMTNIEGINMTEVAQTDSECLKACSKRF